MIDTTRINEWLERYRKAWSTDDPDEVARLFTDEVNYFTAPYRAAISGKDAVVAWWLQEKESAISWTFEYQVIAQEGDLYVVRAVTRYPDGEGGANEPEVFHNLWLVTLNSDGRAGEFVEYWMIEE